MENKAFGGGARICLCTLIVAFSLAGCAPRQAAPSASPSTGPWTPRTLDCRALDQSPVVDANERVVLDGFSVLPPTGPNWCVEVVYGRRGVVFFTSPLINRRLERQPSLAEAVHTFEAHAQLYSARGRSIGSLAELQAFARDWADAVFAFDLSDPTTLLTVRAPRHILLRSSITTDRSLGTDCVRISAEQEERDNPRSPTGVFIALIPELLLCLHPHAPGVLVNIGYSERYPQGHEPHPPLVETLKPQLGPFMRSLQFTPI